MKFVTRRVALCLALLVIASGCGGGGDASTPPASGAQGANSGGSGDSGSASQSQQTGESAGSNTTSNFSEISKYLPEDINILVVVRPQQLLASKTWKNLESAAPDAVKGVSTGSDFEFPQKLKFGEVAEFYVGLKLKEQDPFRITVTKNPINIDNLLIQIYGEYRQVKVGDLVMYEEQSVASLFGSEKLSPEDILTAKPTEPVFDGTGEGYCLVAPNILVVGRAAQLKGNLERAQAPKFSASMTQALGKADLTHPIVVVGGFAELRGTAGPWDEILPFKNFINSAEYGYGQISLEGDLAATLTMMCKDAESATSLHQQALGLMSLAQLQPGAPAGVMEILSAVKLQAEGSRVIGQAKASQDMLTTAANGIAADNNQSGRYGTVEYYAKKLDAPESGEEASYAISRLAEFGTQAAIALPALIKLLDSESTRFSAIRALGDIGAPAESAIPKLIELTKSDDLDTHRAALNALGQMGVARPEVLDTLMQGLNSADFSVQAESIEALGKLGAAAAPAVPRLLELRNEYDRANQALMRIGPGAKAAIPTLVQATLESDDSSAPAVLVAISNEPVQDFVAALNGDSLQQVRALKALALYGAEAAPAIDRLGSLLQSEDTSVREAAARTVLAIGIQAVRATTPELLSAVKDRIAPAASALELLAADAAPAVPDLVAMLDGDSQQQWAALDALAAIGPAAKEALPSVQRLSQGGEFINELVAIRAARAIWKIAGPQEALEQLQTMASSTESYSSTPIDALKVLIEMGPDAAGALPKLVELAKRGDGLGLDNSDMREHAIQAIGAIGPAAMSAVPLLMQIAKEKDSYYSNDVAANAAEAIGNVAPPDRDTVIALARMVRRQDYGVSARAALALSKMKEPARIAIPALQESMENGISDQIHAAWALWKLDNQAEKPMEVALLLLGKQSGSIDEQELALKLLTEMGSKATVAVPVLLQMSWRSDTPELRRGAYEALQAIDPQAASQIRPW